MTQNIREALAGFTTRAFPGLAARRDEITRRQFQESGGDMPLDDPRYLAANPEFAALFGGLQPNGETGVVNDSIAEAVSRIASLGQPELAAQPTAQPMAPAAQSLTQPMPQGNPVGMLLEDLMGGQNMQLPSGIQEELQATAPEQRPGFMDRIGQAFMDNQDFFSDMFIGLAQGMEFGQAVAYGAQRKEEREAASAAAEIEAQKFEMAMRQAEAGIAKDLATTGKLNAETQKLLTDMAKGDEFSPETYARLYADAVKHINSSEFLEDPNNPPLLDTTDQARFWINSAVPESERQYSQVSAHHVQALLDRLEKDGWTAANQTRMLEQFEVVFGKPATNVVAQQLLKMSGEQ